MLSGTKIITLSICVLMMTLAMGPAGAYAQQSQSQEVSSLKQSVSVLTTIVAKMAAMLADQQNNSGVIVRSSGGSTPDLSNYVTHDNLARQIDTTNDGVSTGYASVDSVNTLSNSSVSTGSLNTSATSTFDGVFRVSDTYYKTGNTQYGFDLYDLSGPIVSIGDEQNGTLHWDQNTGDVRTMLFLRTASYHKAGWRYWSWGD